MQSLTIYIAVSCSLHIHLASSANLRHRSQPRPLRKNGCTKLPFSHSFLEAGNALVPTGPAGSGLGARGGVTADGYSRVACEVDIAPVSQRISFKEHACGDGLKSCRLTELGMTPRLCFDFCRQYENAKFFGLHAGRDCYCSVYYQAHTTGGGECDAVCEGDKKEFCGGMDKSSMFEMHMCGDSATEAETVQTLSLETVLKSDEVMKIGDATVKKVLALAASWKLNVCSLKPEGQRVCALPTEWTAIANKITGVSVEVSHDTEVLNRETKNLYDATEAIKSHAKDVNSSMMSKAELATEVVRNAAAKVAGDVEMMKGMIKTINGPLVGETLAKDSFSVFEPLGDVKANWFAVCALVPVPGQSYVAVAKDDPALCAAKCLSLSTGTESCAAFNYQYKDGLAACQLLTATGVVVPDDAINGAVPIFEVSKTKRDAMGIESMGCYAHGHFTAGHPRGPLGTKVVKEVIVAGK